MTTYEQTIKAIITHLRATRPELVHFAGAMHRDPAARRVIEEYLVVPAASEQELRERARTRPVVADEDLSRAWLDAAWFRLALSTEQPGARQDV